MTMMMVVLATAAQGQTTLEGNRDRAGARTTANADSLRSSPEELLQKIQDLERKINFYANEMKLGNDVITAWQNTYKQIIEAFNSHASQKALCQQAKKNLQSVKEKGDTPPAWLAESEKHAQECDDRAGLMRSHLESLKAEIEEIRYEVNHVETVARLDKDKYIEVQNAKKGFEQVLNITTNNLRKKMDAFKQDSLGL
jgi:chromosome segregation ATPase